MIKTTPVKQKTLNAEVIDRSIIATDVVCLRLRSADATPFPVAKAGAHIDIFMDSRLVRQYSLTQSMSVIYTIAV